MKVFFVLLFLGLIVGFALNRVYASIYQKIGEKQLINPNLPGIYSINESSSSAKRIKYVAIGDSLTAGVGTTNYQDSFPYILSEKIAKSGQNIELTNLGIPGARTQDIINSQLQKTIFLDPDIITLLVGVNDIHGFVSGETFQKNYQKIVDNLTAKTKAKIIIINIPYLGAKDLIKWPYNLLYQTRTTELNKVIKKIAQNKNLILIDLYEQTRKPANENNYYSIDQFHPSAEGYKLWSNIIYANSHL